jgi:hypothetical protein
LDVWIVVGKRCVKLELMTHDHPAGDGLAYEGGDCSLTCFVNLNTIGSDCEYPIKRENE